MSFEIFGEHQNRTSASLKIKNEISQLRRKLKSQSTEVYNKRIPMQSLNSLGSLLQEVKRLRKKYSSTSTIVVKFDGTGGDNVLPVVHIISDDARAGQQAHGEIQKVLYYLIYQTSFTSLVTLSSLFDKNNFGVY